MNSVTTERSPAVPRTWATTWAPRLIWANLVGQILIVVSGGAVRLTGSGLGCSTWPQCEPGSFTPQLHEETAFHSLIEYGNRMVGVVLGFIAIALALALWRHHRARALRWYGLAVLVGTGLQGGVGGISVLVDLHPAVVGLHLLLSMALIWVSTVLLRRFREGDGPAAPLTGPRLRTLSRAVVVTLVPVLVLGMVTTGAGPHSGDDQVGYRFAVDPVLIARIHAASVWVFVALVVALVIALRRSAAPARVRDAAGTLLAVTVAQGAIGYVQYFTGLPELLVGVHLLGAALLTAATAWAHLALRERR